MVPFDNHCLNHHGDTMPTVLDVMALLQAEGADFKEAANYLRSHHPAAFRIPVYINSRLRSTAGMARHPSRKRPHPRIDLNPRLQLEPLAGRRRTFLHELAHLLAPRGSGHGFEWRYECHMLGLGFKVPRCHSHSSMRRHNAHKVLLHKGKAIDISAEAIGFTFDDVKEDR